MNFRRFVNGSGILTRRHGTASSKKMLCQENLTHWPRQPSNCLSPVIALKFEAFCFARVLGIIQTTTQSIQALADRSYALLKNDPRHPSLHLKKVDRYRSVRVGLHYRAVAVEVPNGLLWFWIGSHEEYNKLMG